MATYSFRCNEIVSARTVYVNPGTGLPSTYRSVHSSRRRNEVLTATDLGLKGRDWKRQGADTVSVVDPEAYRTTGKGFHSNEVLSAADTVRLAVTYRKRITEVVRARDTNKSVHIYVIRHDDTASAVDSGTGKKQFWVRCEETVQAVETGQVSGTWNQFGADVASPVDSVRIQIRQRPGVGLTLHPDANGTYQDWLKNPPGAEAWQNVSEKIPDGDNTTVYVNSEPGEASTFTLPPLLIPVSSPHRITGLTLRLVAKGDGAVLQPRFVLRGKVYDGAEFTLTTEWQTFYTWWPVNPLSGRPWTTSALVDLEVGVVNAGTIGAALTTVTAFVATEPTPYRFPVLTAGGKRQDWSVHPSSGTDFDAVRQEDGARSYLFATSAITTPVRFNIYNTLDGETLLYSLGGPTRTLTFDGQGHNPINMDEVVSQIQAVGISVNRCDNFGQSNPTGAYLTFPGATLTLIAAGSTAWADLGFTGVTDLTPIFGQRHTVRSADADLWIPPEFRVDKVNLVLRALGEGTISPLVRDEENECLGPYGQWPLELGSSLQTFQIPFHNRPSFPKGMSRWDLDTILAADWGVQNDAGDQVKLDYARVEVFASLTPEEEVRLLPTADGTFSEWPIGYPDIGESSFQDVSTFLPDDSRYLRAVAIPGSPVMSTFAVGVTGAHNWYDLRWRVRIRKTTGYVGNHLRFAPVIVTPSDHYIGRQFYFNSEGADFAEVVEDFWVNPITGKPWGSMDLQDLEIGIVLYEGAADLSWCVADAGIVPPRVHSSSALLCEFTSVGLANVARATSQGLVWKIDRYQIGRGGYQRDNPAVTQPTEPGDTTLEDLVYTGKVNQVSQDGWTAHYWIAVPPDAMSEPIGEVMLMARVLHSNNPADVVGSYFPMAVAHFPAGFHTARSIRVIRLDLNYAPAPSTFLHNWGSGNWGGGDWGG